MKEERMYLVSDGMGNVFALTPAAIDNNNSKGAGFALLKVDDEGRAYLEDTEPTDDELYGPDDINVKKEPTYRIVNYTHKTLISKHDFYGKAAKALEDYDNRSLDRIAIHNITHSKCPKWVKEL